MAKINFGAAVLDARGKLGGMVYSANKGGAYIRRKASPTGTTTAAQALVRANFGANAKMWSAAFTATQRSAWTFFAAANPVSNVFGNSIVLSGLAMAQRLNQVLNQVGGASESDPPADLSVPTMLAPETVTAGQTAGVMDVLKFATAAQVLVPGAAYYVFATGQLSAGKTPQKNDYRFIGSYVAIAAAIQVSILDNWLAIFGTTAPVGNVVGILIATVNTTTGAVTPGLKFTAIIT